MATLDDPLTARRLALALLTPEEMARADRLAVAGGLVSADMMEMAGQAVAQAILKRWTPRPVTILCGPGNNGGDGFVAARGLVDAGWAVKVALLGDPARLPADAAHHAALWRGEPRPLAADSLEGAALVIDALFGSGLSRPLEGIARDTVEALAAGGLPVCAVDFPSGLDGASGQVQGAAAPAELTVTFFRKKPGHLLFPGRRLCGQVVVAEIGTPAGVLDEIDPQTFENGPDLWLEHYPWPELEGHKYLRGEVLVLGGEQVTGASRMTALSAMRAGAGLVTLAAPAATWAIYAAALPGMIVRKIGDDVAFESLLTDKRRNVVAIGPGAGVGAATRRHVLSALATGRAVVIDADAITAFAETPDVLFAAIVGPCVLTPHAGEFGRIFGPIGAGADKLARTRAAAVRSGAIVVLKGADTVIAAPDGRAIVNANAPPQLATGGSGDVLTGLVAGLLAQGMAPFEAAAAAVWLHGQAASTFGLGLVAGDLPDAMPAVLQALARSQT